jgi:hypothetical protein
MNLAIALNQHGGLGVRFRKGHCPGPGMLTCDRPCFPRGMCTLSMARLWPISKRLAFVTRRAKAICAALEYGVSFESSPAGARRPTHD